LQHKLQVPQVLSVILRSADAFFATQEDMEILWPGIGIVLGLGRAAPGWFASCCAEICYRRQMAHRNKWFARRSHLTLR
jgi:hypothetical protein